MTLPTTLPLNGSDDDSDMFGPPRSSPVGYCHQRSRVPMISPKLRQREERKRILQLSAHKLERIKDSEANLRRSVCINNTYSRLTDEVRREKQSRFLANLPKSETKPETAHDNIFSPYHNAQNNNANYNSMELRNDPPFHHPHHLQRPPCSLTPPPHQQQQSLATGKPTIPSIINNNSNNSSNNSCNNNNTIDQTSSSLTSSSSTSLLNLSTQQQQQQQQQQHHQQTTLSSSCHHPHQQEQQQQQQQQHHPHHHHHHHHLSSCAKSNRSKSSTSSLSNVDADLEILDRELSAINASMPLIDPEITQGAEQLEKAVSSRKRLRSEDENDRLVREALSQFYLPTQRLISAIDDCPLDIKRSKMSSSVCGVTNNNNNNNNSNNIINNNLSGSLIGSLSNSGVYSILGSGGASGIIGGNGLGIIGGIGGSCISSNASTNFNLSSFVGNTNLNGPLGATTFSSCGGIVGIPGDLDLDLGLDINQSQKDFEVIMDAIRLGTSSPTPSTIDSCGQAAMMSESGVFHNLVVTSLET